MRVKSGEQQQQNSGSWKVHRKVVGGLAELRKLKPRRAAGELGGSVLCRAGL